MAKATPIGINPKELPALIRVAPEITNPVKLNKTHVFDGTVFNDRAVGSIFYNC